MTVENVGDPSVGIPAKSIFLSKFEREDSDLDPDLLGTIEAYLPSTSKRIPAPTRARGVSVIVAGAGQGVRTINVYMVNVSGPESPPFRVYRRDVSDGWESAFSAVQTFSLTDTQTLTFTPEALAPPLGSIADTISHVQKLESWRQSESDTLKMFWLWGQTQSHPLVE